MKRCLLLLVMAMPLLLAAAPETARKEVYLQSDLKALLKTTATDSVLRIERLASLEFHKLINAYRKQNGKDSLRWNDTLWLAAHNHCAWMAANNELNHYEKPGTKFYSGYAPGDRYVYVTSGYGRFSWSGENALYNFSDDRFDKETDRAKSIAQYSFNQWKNSPGHNANMLNGASRFHGEAFYLDRSNGQVWATDLFTYSGGSYHKMEASQDPAPAPVAGNNSSQTVDSGKDEVVVALPPKKAELAKKKMTPAKVKAELGNWAVQMNKEEGDAVLAKAAGKHAAYLASMRSLPDARDASSEKKGRTGFTGETTKARVLAATKGFKKLRYRKYAYDEKIAVMDVKPEDLDVNEIENQLLEKWGIDKGEAGAAFGVGLEVKKIKTDYRVVAVCVNRK